MNATTRPTAADNALNAFIRSGRARYRFRSFSEHHPHEPEEILLQSRVFFGSVSTMDDIYEGSPTFVWDARLPTLDELIAKTRRHTRRAPDDVRRKIAERMLAQLAHADSRAEKKGWIEVETLRMFRNSSLCCFFRDPFEPRRWGDYADRGTGFALIFDFSDGWSMQSFVGHPAVVMTPFRVEYLQGYARPVIEMSFLRPDVDDGLDYIRKGLLTKSSAWAEQREFRIPRIGIPGSHVGFPSASLVGLIFGIDISAENRRLINEINARRDPPLPIFECRRSPGSYALDVGFDP